MHEYRMKFDILISAMIAYTHEWISFFLYGIWWFIVFNKRDGVKLIILGNFDFHQVSMHTKVVEKMKISWKNSVSWGKWKSWLPWFQSIFRFFSKSKIDVIIWVLRFLKSKGLWWKKSEKNRFLCLIPQKNRLKKCRLEVKSVFKNIDFWGSYGLKCTKKWLN